MTVIDLICCYGSILTSQGTILNYLSYGVVSCPCPPDLLPRTCDARLTVSVEVPCTAQEVPCWKVPVPCSQEQVPGREVEVEVPRGEEQVPGRQVEVPC